MKKSFCIRFVLCVAVFALATASHAVTPRENSLLSLVPSNAQIVAGMESGTRVDGQLFVTHDLNLDYDDFLGLAHADSAFWRTELVEVAASTPPNELDSHLIMVAGGLNRTRIFHAAEQNGARSADYRGLEILAVSPFPREQSELKGTRWLAILDDHIALFGSPHLVQEAIDRHIAHCRTDLALLERIRQVGSDVDSWTVFAMPPKVLERHLITDEFGSDLKHLLASADEVAIGIRSGAVLRIDFAVHTTTEILFGFSAAAWRAELQRADLMRNPGVHLARVSFHNDRILGSVSVPTRVFDTWLASIPARRSLLYAQR